MQERFQKGAEFEPPWTREAWTCRDTGGGRKEHEWASLAGEEDARMELGEDEVGSFQIYNHVL